MNKKLIKYLFIPTIPVLIWILLNISVLLVPESQVILNSHLGNIFFLAVVAMLVILDLVLLLNAWIKKRYQESLMLILGVALAGVLYSVFIILVLGIALIR